MAYAEGTEVPVERSRAEIEKLLTRYGADQFYSGWEANRGLVGFRARSRLIRFVLIIPPKDDKRFARDGRGSVRTPRSREAAWEKECRRLWRSLALLVKAKLEAVESRITTFEEAFLAHTVLPDGKTFAEWAIPQIADIYTGGRMPRALPGLGETLERGTPDGEGGR